MTQVIERRSRAEFLALTGRRDFAPRPLTAEQRDKIARAIAIKTRRDALVRNPFDHRGRRGRATASSRSRAPGRPWRRS